MIPVYAKNIMLQMDLSPDMFGEDTVKAQIELINIFLSQVFPNAAPQLVVDGELDISAIMLDDDEEK
jgi:hypothetical protein